MTRLNTIYIVVILALVLTSCTATSDQRIPIGFASALSGSGAKWGQPVKQGFAYGIEQINKNGGVNGKRLEVTYKDTKCDAATGRTAFNNLITLQNTKLIAGTVCSSVAMSVTNLTQANNVLYLASGATHPKVPQRGDKVFRLWVSDGYEAKALAEHATNELGLERFAIGYNNDNPWGVAVRDNFRTIAEQNGGTITEVQGFSSERQRFDTMLTKMLATNPDALYLPATPSQTEALVSQARSQGFDGPLFLYGTSATAEGVLEAINDSGPIYYGTPSWNKQGRFWNDFENATGTKPNVLHALGYDSAMLIKDGIQECGQDTDCIRDYYHSLQDYETTRANITFDATGDLKHVPFTIQAIR